MPIGNKTVLMGISERTTARMVEQIAKTLLAEEVAERIIACQMTRDRAHMHLGTVFTFLDRDAVTVYPDVVDEIVICGIRPADCEGRVTMTCEKTFLGSVADALGIKEIRVVPTWW